MYARCTRRSCETPLSEANEAAPCILFAPRPRSRIIGSTWLQPGGRYARRRKKVVATTLLPHPYQPDDEKKKMFFTYVMCFEQIRRHFRFIYYEKKKSGPPHPSKQEGSKDLWLFFFFPFFSPFFTFPTDENENHEKTKAAPNVACRAISSSNSSSSTWFHSTMRT